MNYWRLLKAFCVAVALAVLFANIAHAQSVLDIVVKPLGICDFLEDPYWRGFWNCPPLE